MDGGETSVELHSTELKSKALLVHSSKEQKSNVSGSETYDKITKCGSASANEISGNRCS